MEPTALEFLLTGNSDQMGSHQRQRGPAHLDLAAWHERTHQLGLNSASKTDWGHHNRGYNTKMICSSFRPKLRLQRWQDRRGRGRGGVTRESAISIGLNRLGSRNIFTFYFNQTGGDCGKTNKTTFTGQAAASWRLTSENINSNLLFLKFLLIMYGSCVECEKA